MFIPFLQNRYLNNSTDIYLKEIELDSTIHEDKIEIEVFNVRLPDKPAGTQVPFKLTAYCKEPCPDWNYWHNESSSNVTFVSRNTTEIEVLLTVSRSNDEPVRNKSMSIIQIFIIIKNIKLKYKTYINL